MAGRVFMHVFQLLQVTNALSCCMHTQRPAYLDGVILDSKELASRGSFYLGTLPLRVPPKLMLVIMAVAIFIAEALVMVMLGVMEIEEYWVETLIDSTSLLLILTPVYLFFYRPFWVAQKQH